MDPPVQSMIGPGSLATALRQGSGVGVAGEVGAGDGAGVVYSAALRASALLSIELCTLKLTASER